MAMAVLSVGMSAQEHEEKKDSGFVFTTVKENPITSIKDQNQSGTCWCFSTLSFLESELMRMGKGEHDLCEMFVVHKTMEDRAVQTVRTHGDVSFSQGGSFYDVLYCLENYGIVPQEAMPGGKTAVEQPQNINLAAGGGEGVKIKVVDVDVTLGVGLGLFWPQQIGGVVGSDAFIACHF